MILVLLGTQDKSFVRLLEAIQKQIDNKVIKEEVIVQAGYTKFDSKKMKIFDLIPNEDLQKYQKEANFIITHGGVASIMECLRKGKKIIAAARLKKYKENDNDHQLQIVEEFAKEGYILELKDFYELDKLIKKIEDFKPKKVVSNTNNMVKLIEDYIDSI